MGGKLSKLLFKRGKDKNLNTKYTSLLDIPAIDIDGFEINPLGRILEGKRCIMVVNVATN
jgi:hypothetical protein